MKMTMKLFLSFTIFLATVAAAQSPQTVAPVSDQFRLQWQFDTKG
jgi:hypothetical protein